MKYIFYDNVTGDVIIEESRKDNIPSVERVIEIYPKLNERKRESYDVLILGYSDYAQDFAECNGYRVNVETKELEFSYPNPNEERPNEPVYQKPLSEQVKETKARITDLELTIAEMMTF